MLNNFRTRRLLSASSMGVLSAATFMWAGAPSAYGQTAEVFPVDEIVVTARRKSESLQDVPGSITAITAATIQKAGVERAEDFIGLTPGVTLVNAAEAGDTQVNIRGINGARDAENSFAFIVDGVLYTNPAAFNREYTNLQQIEVFKGPQGALYGRNAAAGAIIVTTDKPDDEFNASFTASAAQDASYFLKGGVSGPLSDTLSGGLSFDYRTTDGFYENSYLNNSKTIDTFEGFNINGRLVYEPTDDFSLDVKARIGEIDASAIVFNANFHLPAFAEGPPAQPAANQDVNEHDFLFQNNVTSDNDQSAIELSAKFDYSMDDLTLTGWTLYSDIENDLIADGTSAGFGFYNNDATCQETVAQFNDEAFPLPPPTSFGESPVGVIFTGNGSFLGAYTPSTCDGIQEQLRNQKDLSAELRLASSGAGQLDWMVGGYVLDIDRQVGVSLNHDDNTTPTRGLVQLTGGNRTDQLAYDDFDSSVYAVFGSVDYAVSDAVDVSAALRYDVEERKTSSLVPTDAQQSVIDFDFDRDAGDPLNPGLSSLVNATGTIPDKEATFKQLQPKLSATWKPTDNATVFGTWGVGFKAGGFNNAGSGATVEIFNNGLIRNGHPDDMTPTDFEDLLGINLPIITDDYDKETSSALEVGFKSSHMDNRLKLSGAGYFTNVEDMQFFEFFVGGFGLLRVVSNIDEVELMGLELGADFAVSDSINLYAGMNVIESEIKANSSRPDTVGNKSPYTPDYTFNVGGDFTAAISPKVDFLIRADAQFIGPTWFHTVQGGDRATIFNPLIEFGFGPDGQDFFDNAGFLGTANYSNAQRDAYALLDLRAGLQTDTWSLMAFAQNATDEDYLEEVIPAPEFGGTFLAPGTQSRYGLEVSYRF